MKVIKTISPVKTEVTISGKREDVDRAVESYFKKYPTQGYDTFAIKLGMDYNTEENPSYVVRLSRLNHC